MFILTIGNIFNLVRDAIRILFETASNLFLRFLKCGGTGNHIERVHLPINKAYGETVEI